MRLENWQTDLTNLINEKRETPFELGEFDCSLWSMLAICAVSGLDLYSKYYGKYKSQKGALNILAKVDGVGSPLELFEKHLGEEKPVVFARKGDIVILREKLEGLDIPTSFDVFGPVPGVCYGQRSIFVGETGSIEVETSQLGGCLWVS